MRYSVPALIALIFLCATAPPASALTCSGIRATVCRTTCQGQSPQNRPICIQNCQKEKFEHCLATGVFETPKQTFTNVEKK